MPKTAKWIGTLVPELANVQPLDPRWAIRAQVEYMYRLHRAVQPMGDIGPLSECSRWAFALRGYNGGEGNVKRDRIAAWRIGIDPNAWRAVGIINGIGRSEGNFKENTLYPVKILLKLMQKYLVWGPGLDCVAVNLHRAPDRPILIIRTRALA
jgi:hypothetical protein